MFFLIRCALVTLENAVPFSTWKQKVRSKSLSIQYRVISVVDSFINVNSMQERLSLLRKCESVKVSSLVLQLNSDRASNFNVSFPDYNDVKLPAKFSFGGPRYQLLLRLLLCTSNEQIQAKIHFFLNISAVSFRRKSILTTKKWIQFHLQLL